MPEDHGTYCAFDIDGAIVAELNHIRKLGSKRSLLLASSNLGAYEALLLVLRELDGGLSVTRTIEGVQTPFCSQSGLAKRLRVLRNEGLIDGRVGKKGSEVCLTVAQTLRDDLISAILDRHRFIQNRQEHDNNHRLSDPKQRVGLCQTLEDMHSMSNRQVHR